MVVQRRNLPQHDHAKFDTMVLDVGDQLGTKALLDSYKPDLLLHLAGGSPPNSGKPFNEEKEFRTAAFLLENAARIGTKRAVLLGSASEYGDNSTPFSEDMKTRPVSPNGRAKARITDYAVSIHRDFRFGVTVLRPFTVYGPGQPQNMFISQLVTHAILNHDFKMSDGVQKRDLVFVDDVAHAIVLAAESEKAAGRVINIGSGHGTALKDIATDVWARCSADKEKLHIGAKDKSGDDSIDTVADIRLAAELLSWHPQTSLRAGLDKTIDALRADPLTKRTALSEL